MSNDFIHQLVASDLRSGKFGGRVVTRFPPEPNGYPHIGHAKSICLNFGLARDFGGVCHLRFDDTNPETESLEYVEAFLRDIRWLGFEPGNHVFHASDYYEQLYAFAVRLIERGSAYVCPLSEEEIRAYRGTISEPGRASPGRDRSVAQNLDMFTRMRAGEFADGACTLRARIDMSAANMKLRDPLLYRIRHHAHYRTGDAWCLYPMYDYAHPLSDAIERVTHSICTLEFENNRDIYDWLLRELEIPEPSAQTEFARLGLTWCMMSKRRLLQLVDGRYVEGWDDPRMPTLSGMRRRGYRPEALRAFCEVIGVAKANSTVDYALLESTIRDDLSPVSPRVLCVLRPLKVTLTNWPEGTVETLIAPLYPGEVDTTATREIPFSGSLYIEHDDFSESPPKGFFRLVPGGEVRLRHAYVIRCVSVEKDADGVVTELKCTYDPETRSGLGSTIRKVKGTLHWVSVDHALPVQVRLYDRLFRVENPGNDTFLDDLNPNSLTTLDGAFIEPSVLADPHGTRYQFERLGYFWRDPEAPGHVYNRIVPLKDSWIKAAPMLEAKPEVEYADAVTAPRARKYPVVESAETLALIAAGVDPADARIIAVEPALRAWFESSAAAEPRQRAKWVVNEVARDRKLGPLRFDGSALAELVNMVAAGEVSGPGARKVYARMAETGGSPKAIATAENLLTVDDVYLLDEWIAEVMRDNAASVVSYRGGKSQLLGMFIGKLIKISGGRVDPTLATERLQRALSP